MGIPPDENLPEVVPDSTPEALSRAEAYQRRGRDEGDPKFAVVYQNEATTPKFSDTRAPILNPDGTPTSPCPQYSPNPIVVAADGQCEYVDPSNTTDHSEKDPESGFGRQRICGIKRKLFLILLVVAIVVLVAAIGGGVGGAAAARGMNEKAAAVDEESKSTTASSETTPSSTSTTTPPPSSSTSSSTSPTTTPTREPGFNFEAWSEDDFQGDSTDLLRETGFVDLSFNSTSYKWHPNGSDCCVTFCQGTSQNVGWRCTDFERKQASSPFDRLFFGCGPDASEENSRCS